MTKGDIAVPVSADASTIASNGSDGATPSTPSQSILYFGPAVLSHLKEIYGSLCGASQAGFYTDVQHEAGKEYPKGKESGNTTLSFGAFLAYMASPASSATRYSKEYDLSAPISDYFISSSHNTYLTGNQLYSDSSIEAYTNVLIRGCRCLEIDVWDGQDKPRKPIDDKECTLPNDGEASPRETKDEDFHKARKHNENEASAEWGDGEGLGRFKSLSSKMGHLIRHHSSSGTHARTPPGDDADTVSSTSNIDIVTTRCEPRVLHGHTLTKEVSFRDVCYAIRDSAFVTSDLPVIISFEVHACLEQQEIMVEIMKDAWRPFLVDITPDLEVVDCSLPRLGELRKKILIKTKWAPQRSGEAHNCRGGNMLQDTAPVVSTINPVADDKSTIAPEQPAKEKAGKVLHALSRLAVYTRGCHFHDFTQSEATMPTHVFSLSEALARDMHERQRETLLKHNRNFMMRIFPSGMRVNSSNPDPSSFWQQGAQMVALNWQNCDKGMMLNEAMFPGGSGWVLKPKSLRDVGEGLSDANNNLNRVVTTVDLSIRVFACQELPVPLNDSTKNFRPYVTCQLHLSQDEGIIPREHILSLDSEKKYKIRTKASKGSDADYKGEEITFPSAVGIVEELSFLRFKIKNDEFRRGKLAAWACIKLDKLQQGYRLIHLFNVKGLKPAGCLLVKIDKHVSLMTTG